MAEGSKGVHEFSSHAPAPVNVEPYLVASGCP